MTSVKINKKKIVFFWISFLFAINVQPVLASVEISDGSVKTLHHLEDTADSSGNGYNFTNNGSSTFSAGKLSNAADFGTFASNKYFSLASPPILTGNFYWASWIKWPSEGTQADNVVFRLNIDSSSPARHVQINLDYQYNGGTRRLDLDWLPIGQTYVQNTYNASRGDNVWRFYEITYDGSALKLYENRTLIITDTSSQQGNSAWSNSYYLGGSTSGQNGGFLSDEAVLINTIPSDSVRDNLYNSGTGQEVCVTAGCADVATSTASTTCLLANDTSVDSDLIYNNWMMWFYLLFILGIMTFGLRLVFPKRNIL